MTTVLETTHIPPCGGATELSLPLSYFDVLWIHFIPIRNLLFYNHPCSQSDFLDAIIPQLKQSLSLTLKHYLPVAGNILYPLNTTTHEPLIRYVAGDTVPLTIAVSTNDFDDLTGHHARNADQFYDFMPEMPVVVEDSEYKIIPAFALKVTLFPGRGICIGFANHHVLGDFSSIVGFIRAWASISKFGGDDELAVDNLPIFDRSLINDPLGLNKINWEVMSEIPFSPPTSFPLPTNRVRATYILKNSDLNKLKEFVCSEKPEVDRVSSFVATTSYIWSCLVKSGEAVGEEAVNNGKELFSFMVDVRARMDPAVPSNYFGNCLSTAGVSVERGLLAGEEGFVIGVEAVNEVIRERVNRREEVLKRLLNLRANYREYRKIGRKLGISGSPKFDMCGADFGWGRATKFEVLSIDGEKYSVSLYKASDGDGLEIGVSLDKERMEAFAAVFGSGLTTSGRCRSPKITVQSTTRL